MEGDPADAADEPTTLNVLKWMEQVCSVEVLPKILAFSGPQTTRALYRTNRHWRDVILQEGTWKVMCEDLYKVRCCILVMLS